MKTIIVFLSFLFVCTVVYSQDSTKNSRGVEGFVQVLRVNHVDLKRLDNKMVEAEIALRYKFDNKFGVIGFIPTTDTSYALTGGITFMPVGWFRIDVAGGAEFYYDSGYKEKYAVAAFTTRLWFGDSRNDLWLNFFFSDRFWYQGIFLRKFGPHFGLGVIAEQGKGGGLYAQLSPICAIDVFGAVMYNGDNPEKDIGFDLTALVGARIIF